MAYGDHEQEFLTAIADRFGFHGDKDRFIFIERHREANQDLTQEAFADTFAKNLKEWFHPKNRKESETLEEMVFRLYQAVRDRLSKTIYPVLKKEGLKLEPNARSLWVPCQQWLEQELYPQWLQPRLWENLWRSGSLADWFRVETKAIGVQTLGFDITEGRPEYPTVKVGQKIRYAFDLPEDGYLLLLERFSSGELYCLSPSRLCSELTVRQGQGFFPQPTEKLSYLTVQGGTGTEQVLLALFQNQPTLDWLPRAGDDPKELTAHHLETLLQEVTAKKGKLWSSQYLIRA